MAYNEGRTRAGLSARFQSDYHKHSSSIHTANGHVEWKPLGLTVTIGTNSRRKFRRRLTPSGSRFFTMRRSQQKVLRSGPNPLLDGRLQISGRIPGGSFQSGDPDQPNHAPYRICAESTPSATLSTVASYSFANTGRTSHHIGRIPRSVVYEGSEVYSSSGEQGSSPRANDLEPERCAFDVGIEKIVPYVTGSATYFIEVEQNDRVRAGG